jgi:O-antigen/teichoic acid export membrane protein
MIKLGNNSKIQVILNSSIYSINGIIQKAVGFLLLPLYAQFLTVSDFGIVGIVSSLLVTLTLFFSLSLNSSVQRYYFVYKDEPKRFQLFFSTIFFFIFLNSIFLSFIIIFFNNFFQNFLFANISFFPYILIGILSLIFSPLYTIYQNLLQTLQKGKTYTINSFSFFIVTILFNILFIVVFKLGAFGQLLSGLIIFFIFFIISFISLFQEKFIIFRFSFYELKKGLSFSLPLVPHLLSSSVALLVSQLLLNSQISLESIGFLAVAIRFVAIIDIIQVSTSNAFNPWLYESFNKNLNYSQINSFILLIFKFILFINLIFSFFSKELLYFILPSEYHQAWLLLPLLGIAYQIKQIFLFNVSLIIYSMKGIKFIFFASLLGDFSSIIFSVLMTTSIGVFTPAFAMILQWIATSIMTIFLSRYYSSFRIPNYKLVNLLFIFVFSILSLYFFELSYIVSISFPFLILIKVLYTLLIFLILFIKDFKVLRSFRTNK